MNRRRALMSAASSGPAPVHGTWEDLFARIADGTYATAYSVGEILPLDLGTEGEVNAQIVGFNVDSKADNSGNAKITFVTQYALNTKRRFNPELSPSAAPYTEGTGSVGGWEKSEIRAQINSVIKPKFPSNVLNRIVPVKKYSYIRTTSGSAQNNVLTNDDVWLLSGREAGLTNLESTGVARYSVFASGTSATDTRKKSKVGGSADVWSVRSADTTEKIKGFSNTGASSGPTAKGTWLIVIGFCID